MQINRIHIGKAAVSILFTYYTIHYLVSRVPHTLIDNIDLIFHEAGHFVFRFFGEFIMFAGGTFMQLLVPVAILIYFYRQKDTFATAFVLWWVGQNLINVSYYVADARARVLPLLGNGRHDWNYLLTKLGLLNQDELLGGIIFFIGCILMVVALLFMFRKTYTRKK